MKKAKVKSKKAKIFVCLCVVFFVCFVVKSSAQTAEQLEYYSGRIEFGDTEVKRDALFELRNFESEAASRVAIPALRDLSEIVRATATHTVIFIPKDEAAQLLSPLLSDRSEFVRRETAYALGKVGSPQVVSQLINLLQKDKDLEVRTASAFALGQIGDVSAINELVKILQRKPKEKEEFLRRSSARSIGQIAQFIQTLETPKTTPEDFLPRKYHEIEKPRYENLVETFPVFRSAINVLTNSLKNKKESRDVKREAAFALGEIGNETAIPVLQANLNGEDYYLAEIAEQSLWKISVYKEFRESSEN
jgi:HEAT repeat protein